MVVFGLVVTSQLKELWKSCAESAVVHPKVCLEFDRITITNSAFNFSLDNCDLF